MKAFLLAAGFGTRLKPITDTVPKCLVPVKGKPMLGWWLDLFLTHGVTEVLVNTHYLYEPVREFIKEYNSKNTGLTVYEAYEPTLLGSGGTICNNKDFVKDEDDFLICYADNLTDTDLSAFVDFHRQHRSPLTMALFHTNLPKQCGIAALDKNGLICEFVEKPENPKSNLANAGMYVVSSEIFDYLDSCEIPLDFGKDVLPKLVNKMYGWYNDAYLIDVGTMENYEKANKEWQYDNYKNSLED
ncbi:MAG: nucleotidyltransferase family protein [Clostridia bacterium]|nr:nucleotidyltransferase family protein [Clostridia bacterium]